MQSGGEPHTVALRGNEIRCLVRRRRNQKYINIRITLDGEVVVSAPYGVSLHKITESLRKKEQWIKKHLEKVAAGRSKHDPMRNLFLGGVPHTVEVLADQRRKRTIQVSPDTQTVIVRAADTSREHVLGLLQRHLEREARRHFHSRAPELSAATGIPYARLFIRNQRSRWGSSSGRGNISINWRAIMLPPQVQDYLIIHELSHQVHLNHSKAFWTVVERHCPDYRQANKWLREHSLLISLFR